MPVIRLYKVGPTKLNHGKANIEEIKTRLRGTDWDIQLVGDILHQHRC